MRELIDRHRLAPHPEGGFYRETYRAPRLLPDSKRSVCTAILYLLAEGDRSRLHRLDADELWHFHSGGPLQIVELTAEGARVTTLSAENPQHLVPAGTWFGAVPAEGAGYCFVGCTVSPGFEFEHFELGTRDGLTTHFPELLTLAPDSLARHTRSIPHAQAWVERLT